jgi:SAM-dependent methyltransferase
MGKKRLRPGGRKGTEWLLASGSFKSETRVLEVACNMGTTAVELARRYGCPITACDLDEAALEKAEKNVRKAGLKDKITLHKADATALPFEDESFDVVLNEAMLTMLAPAGKEKALASCYRVLRRNGILLTHDVALVEPSPEERRHICRELSRAINVPVSPLPVDEWLALFADAGFPRTDHLTGPMTLMGAGGMLYDEGFVNALRIVVNGLRSRNRPMFMGMRNVFLKRKKQLGFIAAASRK